MSQNFHVDLFSEHKNTKQANMARIIFDRCEPYINNTNLIFFPEYTDHSIAHCNDIFLTCIDIIAEYSKEIISANDKLFLTAAILMHDMGMHLNKQQFLNLINDEKWISVDYFDTKSWKQIWLDFLAEAKRWDSRKLIEMFGDAEPVEIPPKNTIDFSNRNCLLIGEFLRRHHGRLAHEIAINGFPTLSGYDQLLKEIESDERDLIGLIARSHTLSLRKCFPYLKENFHIREHNNIHAVYLMVLLRISDYLQIQASRAPSSITNIKRMKSPFSAIEWKIHQSVSNITYANEDPEAIFIGSKPKNVETFLRTQNWLNGIQQELDNSWAILGEIYGLHNELNKLGLRLRRITSSLDNLDNFRKKVDYIPEKVSFDSANPDLLKLLIDPLYGEDPRYGVRELMQNAVDAVNEKNEFLKQYPQYNFDPEIYNHDCDVEIAIHCNEEKTPIKMTFTDNGIGMNTEIINNYFLKAGASFRKSLAWKKINENEDGKSKVLRSGRFGIGVLACFLIGDEIEIETRHVSSTTGICFSTKIDTKNIELKKINCPVGTRISINISKKNIAYIYNWCSGSSKDWDWFCLKTPKVKRIIYPEKKILKQRFNLPRFDTELGDHWFFLNHNDYDKIFWTQKGKAPILTCNGIIISNKENILSYYNFIMASDEFMIKYPKLNIYDSNGNLPINLQRNGLKSNEKLFANLILQDILKLFFKFIESKFPRSFSIECSNFSKNKTIEEYGVLHQYNLKKTKTVIFNYSPFVFTNNGGILFTEKLINYSKLNSISLISYKESKKYNIDLEDEHGICEFEEDSITPSRMISLCLRNIQNKFSAKYGIFCRLSIKGRLSIIPIEIHDKFVNSSQFTESHFNKIIELKRNDVNVMVGIGRYQLRGSPLINLFENQTIHSPKKQIFSTQFFLRKNQKYDLSYILKHGSELEKKWVQEYNESIKYYK